MASYGIKPGKKLSEEEISQSFRKNKITDFGNFYLNEKIISDLDKMVEKDSNNFVYTNYLVQPLQILIFDNNMMVSQLSNCNLGGFPNLKWDPHLTKFPIEENNSAGFPQINLDQYKTYLSPVNKTVSNLPNKRYTMIVLYSDFMGRQSKRLIKKSIKYFSSFMGSHNGQLIFVNANNSSIENF